MRKKRDRDSEDNVRRMKETLLAREAEAAREEAEKKSMASTGPSSSYSSYHSSSSASVNGPATKKALRDETAAWLQAEAAKKIKEAEKLYLKPTRDDLTSSSGLKSSSDSGLPFGSSWREEYEDQNFGGTFSTSMPSDGLDSQRFVKMDGQSYGKTKGEPIFHVYTPGGTNSSFTTLPRTSTSPPPMPTSSTPTFQAESRKEKEARRKATAAASLPSSFHIVTVVLQWDTSSHHYSEADINNIVKNYGTVESTLIRKPGNALVFFFSESDATRVVNALSPPPSEHSSSNSSIPHLKSSSSSNYGFTMVSIRHSTSSAPIAACDRIQTPQQNVPIISSSQTTSKPKATTTNSKASSSLSMASSSATDDDFERMVLSRMKGTTSKTQSQGVAQEEEKR